MLCLTKPVCDQKSNLAHLENTTVIIQGGRRIKELLKTCLEVNKQQLSSFRT